MIRIKQLSHLAFALKVDEDELQATLRNPSEYFKELRFVEKSKLRRVVNPIDPVRSWQKALYKRVLLPKLRPSSYSHGGVVGRSILSNAKAHIGQRFLFNTDISKFYPSIHYTKVYRLFLEDFECSPDVASLCTRLCTCKHHLALGLITSPILADQLLARVDTRLGRACEQSGLVYTRYVDDISISGPFDLRKSGFSNLVRMVLHQSGFGVNESKHRFGKVSTGMSVTKIRISNGHPDVEKRYLVQLSRELEIAEGLASGSYGGGPIVLEPQLAGKVNFVCWVNPERRDKLEARFRAIDWAKVLETAEKHSRSVQSRASRGAVGEGCTATESG